MPIEMEEFLPVTYEGLNSFLRRKAEIELNEDESRIETELRELKIMIDKKKLPFNTSDDCLLWFLRAKKHRLHRAFAQVQRYSVERHNHMKYYGFLDFQKMKAAYENGICGVLPKRDAEGRAIIFIRLCMWNSSLCDADDTVRAFLTILHFVMEYPATQVSGMSCIFDNHLASVDTLYIFLKYYTAFAPAMNCFPARVQHVAFVNNNILLRSISPILMTVVPSFLRKRISFYGDAKEALPELFDPSILPEEFGGTLGPIAALHQSWIGDMQQFVPKLFATCKYYRRKNSVPYPENGSVS